MDTTEIYGLYSTSNPDEIRYVGKTIAGLKHRLHAHMYYAKKENTHKSRWINRERQLGYKIKIKLLDVVYTEDWQFWEMAWIRKYKNNRLTNSTIGGDSGAENSKRAVILLDKHGAYIQEYESIQTCIRSRGFRTKYVEEYLYNKSDKIKKKTHIYGFQIIYKDYYDPSKNYNVVKPKRPPKQKCTVEQRLSAWKANSLKAASKNSIPIIAINSEGGIVEQFKNVPDACKDGRYNTTGLLKVLGGKRKTHKGLYWKQLK